MNGCIGLWNVFKGLLLAAFVGMTLPLGADGADPIARVRQVGDGVCTVGEIVTGTVRRVDFRLSPEPGSDIRCRIELPPAARWDGRMWGVGNSGWAGSFLPISQFSAWGTAVVTTDLGTAAYTENGKSNEKVWPDCVRRDYDWRATHLMTVYAKRIVEAYYGRPPSRCYFDGGSCGGRQGIGEAIRFPEDYDGVIAHMPGNNPICNEVDDFILWKLTHDEAGKLLFTEDEMHVVSDAAVAYGASRTERPFSGKVLADPFFTADDVDGFLSLAAEKAPRLADPDLRSRLRRLFLGTEHRGRRMTYGKIPGSYLGDEMRRTWHAYFPQFLRSRGQTRATATLDDLDEFVRLYAPTYNACSDDLETFRRRGGKLIVTPGLEDQTDPPRVQIAHFERVVSQLGGDLSAALSFYRVFPVPGCAHGGGRGRVITIPPDGPAVWRQMIDWREKGVAPERFMVPWKDEGVDIPVAPYPKRLVQDDHGNWIEKTFDRLRMQSVDPFYLQCRTRPP